MAYDIFISYKSEDQPWAERLHKELTDRGAKVFYDADTHDGLVSGLPWKPQLEQALAESRALVALWSDKAAQMGSWNDRERFVFQTTPELRTPLASERPVIYVLLNAEPTALSATQFISDLKSCNAYPDITKVSPTVWNTVAEKVLRGVRSDGRVYVETLVLAATASEMTPAELGNTARQQLLVRGQQIGLDDPLTGRYDTKRSGWKPYGTDTIAEILEKLKVQARQNAGIELEFQETDTDIWSPDDNKARLAGERLARKLALIVIDPLSVYAVNVQSRIPFLARCQESPTNAFAILAPHATDDDPLNFLIENFVSGLYRSFFTPPRPPVDKSPSVGMNVRNARELLRVLLMAYARDDDGPASAKSKNPKTSMS